MSYRSMLQNVLKWTASHANDLPFAWKKEEPPMQYEKNITPAFNRTDLKKRLEDIQGEIRYVSYTSEILARELQSLILKIEEISDEFQEEEFFE